MRLKTQTSSNKQKQRSLLSNIFLLFAMEEKVDGIDLGIVHDRKQELTDDRFGTVKICKNGIPYYTCGGYELNVRVCMVNVSNNEVADRYVVTISENDETLFSIIVPSVSFLTPDNGTLSFVRKELLSKKSA